MQVFPNLSPAEHMQCCSITQHRLVAQHKLSRCWKSILLQKHWSDGNYCITLCVKIKEESGLFLHDFPLLIILAMPDKDKALKSWIRNSSPSTHQNCYLWGNTLKHQLFVVRTAVRHRGSHPIRGAQDGGKESSKKIQKKGWDGHLESAGVCRAAQGAPAPGFLLTAAPTTHLQHPTGSHAASAVKTRSFFYHCGKQNNLNCIRAKHSFLRQHFPNGDFSYSGKFPGFD